MSVTAARWVKTSATFLKTFGWRGILRRSRHELRRQFGLFKSEPTLQFSKAATQRRVHYAPHGDWQDLPKETMGKIARRGQRVLDGLFEAYGASWRQFPASPAQWRTQPFTQYEFPLIAWWLVPHLPAGSDIKDVWEPARFAWVYDLVRAHAATDDEAFVKEFHDKLAAWMEANPPFFGPHWGCGQEVAIRALAILHGEDRLVTPTCEQASIDRVERLLLWSAERINDAIGYALSQRNNHGISESAALIHLGVRFRDRHGIAERWLKKGQRLLVEQIEDQFAVDGWYSQHSFTYMRLALEQALLAQRVLEEIDSTLPSTTLARLDAAVNLIGQLVDASNGELPNHGANDGGRALPWSLSNYRDFRPLLTLAALVRRTPLPADVPADEFVTHWLDSDLPEAGPARAFGVVSGTSGWVAARNSTCAVFMFAGKYRHRPGHLDSLHIDVRLNGTELISDPGTFAYNGRPPWNNGLASALVHNGPILDERETAERGPRFLWRSWPESRVLSAEERDGCIRIVAERDGAARREINMFQDRIKVTDTALDREAQSIKLTWLLHPDISQINPIVLEGGQEIRATEDALLGWFSPTYGCRQPSRAVQALHDVESGRNFIETTILLSPA